MKQDTGYCQGFGNYGREQRQKGTAINMFRPLNEFKYTAETGKTYIIYFLKFWPARDNENDYVVKYQIRASDRDFFWYGRISRERALIDLKIDQEEIERIGKEGLENKIKDHLEMLLIATMKKGLDKGFEEPNTEFVFYKEPLVAKRNWRE